MTPQNYIIQNRFSEQFYILNEGFKGNAGEATKFTYDGKKFHAEGSKAGFTFDSSNALAVDRVTLNGNKKPTFHYVEGLWMLYVGKWGSSAKKLVASFPGPADMSDELFKHLPEGKLPKGYDAHPELGEWSILSLDDDQPQYVAEFVNI